MSSRTWEKTKRLAAIIAAATASVTLIPRAGILPGSPAIAAAQDASPAPAAGAPQSTAEDLQRQAALLDKPVAANERPEEQEKREEAARRIVQRYVNPAPGSPESAVAADARGNIVNALTDVTNEQSQLAAAKALAENPAAALPEFVEPLFGMLGKNRARSEAAANALANYKDNPDILDRLTRFINDQSPGLDSARAATIRAMGRIIDKGAAARLMDLLSRDNNPVIQDAIMDAMGEMTSLPYGHDAKRWTDWWQSASAAPNAAWQIEQIRRRADQEVAIRARLAELVDQTDVWLTRLYHTATDAEKQTTLIGYLQSPAPAIRALGASLVGEWFSEHGTPPDQIKAQLRSMIGDSAAEVREEVAKVIGYINDPGAVDALLAQLAVETDPDVQAAIASALAPTHDAKAVPALLKLLSADSYKAAAAAGDALATTDMGKTIRQDSELRPATLKAVIAAMDRVDEKAGTGPLREALVRAAANLHMAAALDLLERTSASSNPRNDARIRRAAVQGLGEIDDAPDAQAQAANQLALLAQQDPDPGVQVDAIKALGRIGTWLQAPALYSRLGLGGGAVDPDVSHAAWNVLAKLFSNPDVTVEQLDYYLDRLKTDSPTDTPAEQQTSAQRELAILLAEASKLTAAGADARLAGVNQDIGATYLKKLSKPEQAIAYFRLSLQYHLNNNDPPSLTDPLVQDLVDSLLQAHKFGDAVRFANERMQADPEKMEMMGQALVDELHHLDDTGDIRTALDLVSEVKGKLTPALRGSFARDFDQLAQQIKSAAPTSSTAPTPPTPSAPEH